MELKELYLQKGEIVTQIEVLQARLQAVNQQIINILNKPELLGTYFSTKILRELNHGCKFANSPNTNELSVLNIRTTNYPYGPNEMLNELAHMRSMINFWEERRIESLRGSNVR